MALLAWEGAIRGPVLAGVEAPGEGLPFAGLSALLTLEPFDSSLARGGA